MTKKRFIKLCMAQGISRNDAAKLAKEASGRKSYAELYLSLPHLEALQTLQRGVARLTKAFAACGVSCEEAIAAFNSWAEALSYYKKKE